MASVFLACVFIIVCVACFIVVLPVLLVFYCCTIYHCTIVLIPIVFLACVFIIVCIACFIVARQLLDGPTGDFCLSGGFIGIPTPRSLSKAVVLTPIFVIMNYYYY